MDHSTMQTKSIYGLHESPNHIEPARWRGLPIITRDPLDHIEHLELIRTMCQDAVMYSSNVALFDFYLKFPKRLSEIVDNPMPVFLDSLIAIYQEEIIKAGMRWEAVNAGRIHFVWMQIVKAESEWKYRVMLILDETVYSRLYTGYSAEKTLLKWVQTAWKKALCYEGRQNASLVRLASSHAKFLRREDFGRAGVFQMVFISSSEFAEAAPGHLNCGACDPVIVGEMTDLVKPATNPRALSEADMDVEPVPILLYRLIHCG